MVICENDGGILLHCSINKYLTDFSGRHLHNSYMVHRLMESVMQLEILPLIWKQGIHVQRVVGEVET